MAKKRTPKSWTRRTAGKRTRQKGELASVTIVPPAVRAKDIDLRAVRRAARDYFIKHPKALERT